MPAAKLTQRAIASFAYRGDGSSRDVRWDAGLPNFGLRIYPTGRKTFVVSYRFQSRKRMAVLGDFGTFTLTQARERARKIFVQVQDGKDPLEEKRRAAQGKTFGDLIETYIERHAKVHKRTWEADQRRLRLHIPAAWKGRKASSITREEIAEVHDRFGLRAPYEANRLLEVLRKMLKLAKIWDFIDEAAPNPAEGIQKFKEKKRKRWVHHDELPRLAEAIDTEPNVYVRAAIWLFLLTGVRRAELLEARWEQVHWDRGTLTLPETKSGEEQQVTLGAASLAILQSIPQLKGNPYILPGAKLGQHLVNIDKPWRRIRTAAEIEDVRLHDLRRTFGSWLSQAGVDLNLIKGALRHANISTTLIYARLGEDTARQAVEEHGQRILEAAGRKGPRSATDGG